MVIPRTEILRYLGVKGTPDEKLLSEVDNASEAVMKVAVPKGVYKKFGYRDGCIPQLGYSLSGSDIRRHLGSAKEIVVLAVTLGLAVDRECAKLQRVSPYRALLFDAAASAAIEAFADEFCLGIAVEIGSDLGDRFSPGYGDLAIDMQRDIQRILSADKMIGLGVADDLTLIPLKSITALAPVGVKGCLSHDCRKCSKRDCPFRKE